MRVLLLGFLALLAIPAGVEAAPLVEAAQADAANAEHFGWLSILPPALAIALALIYKRVVPSLFFGIWLGAWMAAGMGVVAAGTGLLRSFDTYILEAVADADRMSIILFTLMIGGMVGIISKNGGMQGIVNKIIRWADDARKGQLATSGLGLAIFFDDYANTLVVGQTMQKITDQLRISREKLAYLVDSTAAPIATIALVTTWIGFQVGLIGEAVDGIEGITESSYSIFLNSLAYNFYPILAIVFVIGVAYLQRDFGPMYRAEKRARTTGKLWRDGAQVDDAATEAEELRPKEGQPERALNAIVPIVVLIGTVMIGLYYTGVQATGPGADLRDIIGEADPYRTLLWGSLLGVTVAAAMSLGQRILTLEETVEAWYAGLKQMLFAMIILVLAWGLSEITTVLGTAEYLVTVLGEALPAGVVPAIIFVLAAATAFATGTSWGTMGILVPLVIPLVWAVLQLHGLTDTGFHIMYASVASVLAGAVWGDHCSPISDTTILSSTASGCDHIDHVNTQLPYAMVVGLVAIFIGLLPTGFGFPWYVSMLLGAVLLIGILLYFGKDVSSFQYEADGEAAVRPTPEESTALGPRHRG